MRWLRAAMVVVLVFCGAGWAQDQPNPEELNRKYQDALDQLKAAQDRKNELANENEQLKARIAELEKQLEDHKRASAQFAQQTFFLRSHYAAWESFIQRYPRLNAHWRVFLEADVLSAPAELPLFTDSLAPISSADTPQPLNHK